MSPRIIPVRDRSFQHTVHPARVASPTNAACLFAPSPGIIGAKEVEKKMVSKSSLNL